jgi:putative transposase
MYPLVLDLAADSIAVAVTCRVLGFSNQAFDRWRADPVSQRDWDDAHVANAAVDVHQDDPKFRYRFIADELAGQGFKARRKTLNRLWLTDVTEHPSGRGKLCLCAVKDASSTRIVGYSIADQMICDLAVNARGNAVALRRSAADTVVHSDRGSQFRSHPPRPNAARRRPARVDGTGRGLRGQRRALDLMLTADSDVRDGVPLLVLQAV